VQNGHKALIGIRREETGAIASSQRGRFHVGVARSIDEVVYEAQSASVYIDLDACLIEFRGVVWH
jgi:hypothetical protein